MNLSKTARAWLVLGRVSNLPTVWSNCLAGWWLGGAQHQERLPYLFLGGTLIYVAGMFLNDAFDVEFDQLYRKERPIPAGVVTLNSVMILGGAMLIVGIASLFGAGLIAGMFSIALGACVLAYDAWHKKITFAPVLMGACRFFLYLTAGVTASERLTVGAVCGAFAMFAYIIGLSFIARKESSGVAPAYGLAIRWWAGALLVAPMFIAIGRSYSGVLEAVLLVCAILALWIGKCVRYTVNFPDRNIGRAVSGLLAGIALVDWLAVAYAPRTFAVVMIALFLLALGFQRWVQAT